MRLLQSGTVAYLPRLTPHGRYSGSRKGLAARRTGTGPTVTSCCSSTEYLMSCVFATPGDLKAQFSDFSASHFRHRILNRSAHKPACKGPHRERISHDLETRIYR